MLKRPDGLYDAETFAPNSDQCWVAAFDVVARELGDEWRAKFWKRWRPSIESARRRGYRIVKVRLVEVR